MSDYLSRGKRRHTWQARYAESGPSCFTSTTPFLNSWQARYAESGPLWRGRPNIVDFRPGDRVLELGCGNGKTAAWLSARPVELHAIDFSPEAVNLCREAVRQAGGKADIRLMDGRKLLYPDGHFDIVICIHYLAHLKPEDRKKAAKEAERVLKPAGGMLIFREFGTGDFRSGKGRQLPEKRTFERKGIIIHYFTKKEVPRLFPGLKPQSVEIRRWKMCGFQREEVWAEFRKF